MKKNFLLLIGFLTLMSLAGCTNINSGAKKRNYSQGKCQ